MTTDVPNCMILIFSCLPLRNSLMSG